MWATILAVTFLEEKMDKEKEVWEMVAEKAKQWLAGASVEDGKVIQGWWK